MIFSEEEKEIISNVFFEEIIKELDLRDLLIILRLLDGYSNEETKKSIHLSQKGYYKTKNKMKQKLTKFYNLLRS